jgi:H+/gluconate symporter-like permease
MYAWNVRQLADDLIEKRLTQRDEWGYLLVCTVISCTVFLSVGAPRMPGFAVVSDLQWLSSLAIMGVGMLLPQS